MLITWKVKQLQTPSWCEDSHIILLHLQEIPYHAHFRVGQSECASQSCSKITVLCLTLAVHRSVLEVYSSF